jgi:hypothetical protein
MSASVDALDRSPAVFGLAHLIAGWNFSTHSFLRTTERNPMRSGQRQ